MTYFLGGLLILMGLFNVYIGFKEIPSTNWSQKLYDKSRVLFRIVYFIMGAIIIGMGIVVIFVFGSV